MSITKADVKKFFQDAEDAIEKFAGEAVKGIILAGKFLRSTAALLAKDPVLLSAIQAGMGEAINTVAAAAETGGTSVIADAALDAAKTLLINCGHTAEHQLVPIVASELRAAVDATTQATPTVVNP